MRERESTRERERTKERKKELPLLFARNPMELLPTPLLSMDDLDPDDEHSQELLTVSYIFPELKILSNHAATISIPVAPEPPISVVFHDDMTSTAPRTIPHLPPLQLAVVMPEKYPQEAPPDIKLASLWLSEDVVLRLRTELVGLWKDSRDQVLYAMIDHLVQAAERGFDQADGSAAVFPKILEEELISFNKMMLKNVFNQGTYECGVCLGKLLSYILLFFHAFGLIQLLITAGVDRTKEGHRLS